MSRVRKSLYKRTSNRLLHLLCRFLPGSTNLRPALHRVRGVRITGRVFIGEDVYLDSEYPECIEIHDGVQIGPRSMIIAHTRGAGKVVLRENSFVGANSVIVTSSGRTLTIGEGAVLTASSLITSDVPPYTLVGGERAKPLARVTRPFTGETSFDEFVRGLRPLLDKKSGGIK
jgi:acetyltransferase-like isoleucine patch superfamily enzyme